MPALLYLHHQDETEIQIDEDGVLIISQSDQMNGDNKIIISPLYIESFMQLLQTVIKDA
jgi:hypothetical protein